MFDVSLSPDTIAYFLPNGLPEGIIITNYYRIKVLGAICFIFGWLVKCITDAVITYKKRKAEKADLDKEFKQGGN